jgi:hypothetical protein
VHHTGGGSRIAGAALEQHLRWLPGNLKVEKRQEEQ